MLQTILTLSVIAFAGFEIWSEYRGPRFAVYFSKPLTTILILLIAFLGPSQSPFYKYAIVTAIVFSLAGDVFLMLPSDRFLNGLVAFLLAHLFYIAAFAPSSGTLKWWPLIPLAVFGVSVYTAIASSLEDYKVPVLIYLLVIMVMAWFAWERWGQTDQPGALVAFIGAGLFVISDSILAIDRFRVQFGAARALVLATYFAAQWCIAISIWMISG